MSDQIELLDWDSGFFGFPVARIRATVPAERVHAAVAQARADGVQLLYWHASPVDPLVPAVAERVGARLLDRKVIFAAAARPAVVSPGIRPLREFTPGLYQLALDSGAYSRFKLDPRLPPGSFERMYAQWLERSLSGRIAREVLGCGEEGFITLGEKAGRLDIGLLAVARDSRGRGVGRALVEAAFARALEWGYAQVQVVTQQDNEGACRFYGRCGFGVLATELVHHVWLGAGGA